MKHLFQTLLCLLTALHLCGGHLGVMQMVAWAQMIRDYTEENGLIEGLKETFDGEHPCAMCCKIAATKQEERRQPPLPLEKFDKVSKWLGLLPTVEAPAPIWTTPCNEHCFAAPLANAGQWLIAPPTPPPRSVV